MAFKDEDIRKEYKEELKEKDDKANRPSGQKKKGNVERTEIQEKQG